MEKYYSQRVSSKQKLIMVKLRLIAVIACMLLLLCSKPVSIEELKKCIWERTTSLALPLLNYEKENGMKQIDYATDYEVPDWFYEDENAGQNTDLAMEENQNPDTNKVEAITRLNQSVSCVGAITFQREQLAQRDFLLSHIFVVDANTSMSQEETSLETLLDTDMSVDSLVCQNKKDIVTADPKILIYHTHGSESFVDSRPGKVEDTIIGVGATLESILENKYGIPVYHDETLYDVIDGNLDRSKAYENAYNNVKKILEDNPSIEVVIDLHRDGIDEENRLVTSVNGKQTAKIMFLNGVSRSNINGEIAYLDNPNKKMNLAFSFQMYLKGKEKYGDYVRKIYIRSLRYNLHLMPRATLIEVGAQNNTLEEEKNAMEPLADILYEVLTTQS
ncbi:MAG: stage II sporulation protein P [Lachnospiraceae bacterium]